MGTTINKSDLAPEVVAYIDALEDEVADLTSEVEKHDTEAEAEKTAHEDALKAKDDEIAALTDQVSKMVPKDEESEDEITKSVLAKADPAVRSLIEKQAAELKAVQDIAKAERDARLDRDYLSKAETMPMLTTDRSSLAGLLRRAAEALTPEDNEQLNTVLKAANEQIAKGNLFKVAGVGGGETTISKSVAAKAAELRKNDPTLTAEQAEVRVYEENPDLFAQAMSGEDN